MSSLIKFGIAAACLGLSACSSMPPMEEGEFAPTMPLEPTAAQQSNGAIYQDGREMTLFSDLKAHRVGDIITIQLVEHTDAKKSSSTETKKSTGISYSAPSVLGGPVTYHGNDILSADVSGDHSFSGEGGSTQSNQLQGSITVTVAQRLSNGNLVVRGEKWLTLNQGQEYVRITGIIRPADIGPANEVLSTRVANAHISYSGRGALADANQQGWLARFFNSPFTPF